MPILSGRELKGLVAGQIRAATGAQGDRLAQERAYAERCYHGEKFGNEEQGRSQVVSRDVAGRPRGRGGGAPGDRLRQLDLEPAERRVRAGQPWDKPPR